MLEKEEVPLFWSDRFREIHELENLDLKIDLNNTNRDFRVTIKRDIEKKNYWIPGSITFGGFWPLDRSCISLDEYRLLYDELLSINKNCHLQEIKLPPEYFYPKIFINQKKYMLEFTQLKFICEINNHIELSKWSKDKMSQGNKKKVRQFTKKLGAVRKAKVNEYEKCIEVLIQNRNNIGIKLSLTKEKILQLLNELPQRYFMYMAEIGSNICAVAFITTLDESTNYVLYWGDNLEFRHLSPVTSLFLELVRISTLSNKLYLDLGISSLNGEINEGLYRYKKNLGSEDSKKYIFKL
jgi:hypothetical protein